MPRKDQGWITFQLPEVERQLLESYCGQTQRSKTDVLRELVRTLDQPASDLSLPSAVSKKQSGNWEIRAMRVSARNVFPAIVKQVRFGSVNAEILLKIAPVEAVSIITRSSAEVLQLKKGKKVYAMIKSSDVMVAVDD
ncbi:MAG: TOBE domain-containing protein [Acaryochloris sp. RU_4_1]|nr:TOBE domain-containing protein [Acaryochloris sp. SU_5_25]NJM64506.1 TOBE domain-containing protein [Acaryochloris sp. RU_4_1]NJR53399.1 TOBE domain-containing protein [Acaryochloris sp. CRU_2_0]